MALINLQVKFVDGSVADVSALAIDQIKFEAHFEVSLARIQSEVSMTQLYWLAWQIQKRTGQTVLEFEKWAETVEGIEAADPKA
jgi:hypothetical protein